MNNLRYFCLVGMLILFSFTSCSDFLEKNPKDSISNATFWKTEADIKMALAGCYSMLYPLSPLGWNRPYLDCLTDNGYSQWGDYNWNLSTICIGDINPSTGGLSPNIFGNYYAAIAAYNYFIGNIDLVESVDASVRDSYAAEAKFLRALVYFDLVNFYGDIILYKSSPETVEAAKVAQSPKSEALAFVNEDLDFAIANLPNTPYAGHAVRGSAQGLKVRVLMYEEKWEEAAALAKEIMDEGKFSLSGDYEGIFISAGQTNNPEIMFSTVYLSPNLSQSTCHWTNNNRASDIEFGWGSHICPYDNLVFEYECTDGKSIKESPLYDESQPWLNRDPRLKYTIRMPNVTWPGGEPQGGKSLTDYNMQKYVELSKAPFSYSRQNQYDNDYVHLRYADILLMYAEAKNEASGPDASIYDALDAIRSRPGVEMPNVDRNRYNSKETLRDFIRHERRIELALEGTRYFDLKRWKTGQSALANLKTPGGVQLVFTDLLPFPQSEMDLNPNLKQNTGY